MAETPSKRQRDETQMEDFEDFNKRQKSYSHILSILESEEDEPTQDLSSLITTLQQEISSDSGFDPLPFVSSENDQENPTKASKTVEDYASSSSSSSSSSAVLSKEDDQENDKERVMRHLLEASDDELGIPNREIVFDGDNGFNGGDGFSFSDGLWEFEDEAANYYTLLQSDLFM
ncbi:uncharacterized protein LOC107428991 [Ziziphus jujuba]|uniref:Uncharacterized protein LOC107428991 n=2 Tax=Ziziphus jujuba TaxID=326968 RepID=A0A6P4B047_ZIZJJ|nr:uncharacterized protein LOC107428991 [Ziziphus jujuba]KAH7515919.1 hypothetical protein FEM48_Zijuj10G0079300 [Ziziphus jujuba var. spinosa]